MPYTSEMISQRHSSNTKKRKKRRQKREKFFNSTPVKRSNKPHIHSVLHFDDSVNDEDTWKKHITIPNDVKISGWYVDKVFLYKTEDGTDIYKNVFKNPKYGEKHFKIGNIRSLNNDGEITNKFYPMAERFTDIYNIGYCVTGNAAGHSHLQSNYWESFWDTRRGKRHDKYLVYMEARKAVRKEFEKNEVKTINKM
tara:strand:- start:4742 stop:5329 length:588 start_codon:yes stop_codon:yes gene_type:complete